ncbi:MAG: hypothetical protein ABI317_01535 [Gaiellales bacterium]
MGRKAVLVVGLAAAALALPVGASATTGIETSTSVRILLTDKGAVWTPALKKLHPDTNTTYEIKVINQTRKPSTFKLGYRKTKVLKKGASQFFYYSFHLVGETTWTAAAGKTKTASGVFHVKVQKTFSGDG